MIWSAAYLSTPLTGTEQVRIAKIASVVVGAIAIVLGILFERLERQLPGRLGVQRRRLGQSARRW